MREREVAILAAQGLVNSEIANRLGIGATTVKTHVSTLPEKFQVRNRAQLAVVAADRLTPPPEQVIPFDKWLKAEYDLTLENEYLHGFKVFVGEPAMSDDGKTLAFTLKFPNGTYKNG